MAAKRKRALADYNAKRRFDHTPEPRGKKGKKGGWSYVIQKHDATRLHYDFRLELDGVLLSWAVTRGPSLNPRDKRLAIRTEDHPLDYGAFEGVIPEGHYGGGTVMLWDRGTWTPVGDPHEGLRKGKLAFVLDGERLQGHWSLVRFHPRDGKTRQETWLLIKELDDEVRTRGDVLTKFTDSVTTGRSLKAIATDKASKVHGKSAKTTRSSAGAKRVTKGRRRALPKFVAPELATLVDDVPTGRAWLFEVKFDGYRVQSACSGNKVRCYTRNGLDWTGRFGAIAQALGTLDLDGALLDGELVALDGKGRSDFSALQKALNGEKKAPLAYFVFDLLRVGGKDLRRETLVERKKQLQALLKDAPRNGLIHFSDHVASHGDEMLKTLCRKGYEGLIAKRADRPYRSGRAKDWLKVKCGFNQEFVIVGYTPSDKDRPFASLLLAERRGRKLAYAGRVGTGFDGAEMQRLDRRFHRLERATPPLDDTAIPSGIRRGAQWLKPDLVAEIGFAGFTGDNLVRHGRYLGLRADKKAKEVKRERAVPVEDVA